MTQGFLTVGEIQTNAHPGSYGSDPALARQSGSRLNTLETGIPLMERANIANGANFFRRPGSQVCGFYPITMRFTPMRP